MSILFNFSLNNTNIYLFLNISLNFFISVHLLITYINSDRIIIREYGINYAKIINSY